MKIVFISNTDGAMYVFRKPLLERLLTEDFRLTSISSDGMYFERLASMGIKTVALDFVNSSVSLGCNARILLQLRKMIAAESPDIVHNFTHKPSIFGTIAAKIAGVDKVYATITGLGLLFTSEDLKTRVLRFLLLLQYKIALRFITKVFFLNPDDLNYFLQKKLIAKNKAILLNGEGLDLSDFKVPTEEEIYRKRKLLGLELGINLEGKVVLMFPARALKEKGVNEFYEAARIVNTECGNCVFVHLGLVDTTSRSNITRENIETYSRSCGVFYLGFKENIHEYMAASDVVVLPSYREGVPRSLIEALAFDKYIITSDVPGCRETVIAGWNGLFCQPGSADDLASKIREVVKGRAGRTSGRSRALCEEKFNVESLIDTMLRCYRESGEAHG